MGEDRKKPFWHLLIPWKLIVFMVIAGIWALFHLAVKAVTGNETLAASLSKGLICVLFVGIMAFGVISLFLGSLPRTIMTRPPRLPKNPPPSPGSRADYQNKSER